MAPSLPYVTGCEAVPVIAASYALWLAERKGGQPLPLLVLPGNPLAPGGLPGILPMHPEYAPFGNASETLIAITSCGNNAVRGLSGRELRRETERRERKAAKRVSISDRKLNRGF